MLDSKLVIIKVDGGIVSQLYFFAVGKLFEKKGYRVKYDITWFEQEGRGFYSVDKGYNQVYNVNWDIPKIFPNLHIEIASKSEIDRYKKFATDSELFLECKPPLYIIGYNYSVNLNIVEVCREIRNFFIPLELMTNDKIKFLGEEIKRNKSCGVHIRRGDLSKEHVVYGKPTDIDYFLRCINIVMLMHKNIKLYFFSDDNKWVKENIVPHIKEIDCVVSDTNTPEQGYLDLYFLSLCKIIIGSHGSMGFGAKLLSQEETLFITPKYNSMLFSMHNIMMINFEPKSNTNFSISKVKKIKYKILVKIYYYIRQILLRKFLITRDGL
ncbi:TPA: alpha-1,2-fucosyltransferase [Campylobacter coli]|uniref:alpha-1,2-fucosyltransferase n=1 Tax=Campylobacter coli TaxID=195 RepID=UPI0009316F2E|nr:alpha-1,2-fucosyltransferase [Campylobacter coli]OOX89830.1 alpha-1,2-fucosyltransferase [Campylobacter coli]HEB7536937.1 alpha-1,2-fucosyltransferase [Campylobacter coli]HEG0613684.1 alpha-1,2-fucosyltransferase [Campylobacter coli]